ncbi:MAG: Ig-like domain-containing protein [Pseudomonadota bacterium]
MCPTARAAGGGGGGGGGGSTANTSPVAVNDFATFGAESPARVIDVTANDSDVDGDALTITALNTAGLTGAASIADGGILYDPAALLAELDDGALRSETFTYTVSDGNGGTATATVRVTVQNGAVPPPVNTAPNAREDSFTIAAAGLLMGDVFADNGAGVDTDADGDTITVSAVNGMAAEVGAPIVLASGASLTLSADGTFSYDASSGFDDLAAGETAIESFTYTIDDGFGGTDTATATIEVTGALRPASTDGNDSFAIADLQTAAILDGGDGLDSAEFSAPFSFFTLERVEDGFRLVPQEGAPQILRSIEQVAFPDETLALSFEALVIDVAFLYEVGFDREADTIGISFWSALAESVALIELARVFLASEEFEILNGTDLTNSEIVDVFYDNSLDRPSDDGGRAFWTGELDRGAVTREELMLAFVFSDETREINADRIEDGFYITV